MNVKEFIQKYYKIKTKEGKLIPFKFNQAQDDFYEIIKQNYGKKPGRYIVLKARQMGISTFTEAFIFNRSSCQFYSDSVIIAHQSDAARKIYEMTNLFYDSLPDKLKPKKKYSNAKMLVFDDPDGNRGLKSSIRVSVANDASRGSTYRYAHLSELAFWEHPETAMLAVMQAIPNENDTVVVIESTANGFNYFYDLWKKAENRENDFIPIFFPWYIEPKYRRKYTGFELTKYEKEIKEKFNLDDDQLEWRRWAIANNCNGDEELFRQEYPITPEEAFITSGKSVFNTQKVLDRINELVPPIRKGYFSYDYDGLNITNIHWIDDEKGYIRIYKEPTNDYTVLSGDTAGDGSDYFAGHVLDRSGYQCAVLHHQFDEDLFTKQMFCLGTWYRSLIGNEVNFSTYPTMELQRLCYPLLYTRKKYDQKMEAHEEKFGFKTTPLTRPIIISNLKIIMRDHIELINDLATLQEALSFINKDGKPQASDGTHDDLIMSLAIGYEILKQIPEPDKEQDVNYEEQDDYESFFNFGG